MNNLRPATVGSIHPRGWGRDRELNPGLGIHSPTGYRYPTPAMRICEIGRII